MKNFLIIVGLVFMAISATAFTSSRMAAPPPPGQLVPEDELIVWRTPERVGNLPSGKAEARFEVTNTGGSPVRILSVESGCGCAKPEVRPSVIAPGATGFVDVKALAPPTGERVANITLHTDSRLTPVVELRLRMVGTRRPPYVLSVAGDLTYLGGDSHDQVREVLVATVEPSQAGKTPVLESDLDFIEIGAPILKEEVPHDGGAYAQRIYRYPVRFSKEPPDGTFVGQVQVTDPWNPGFIQSLNIHGRSQPAIRALPSRVALRKGSDEADDATASFLVMTAEPSPELLVEAEHDDRDIPFTVEIEPLGGGQSGLLYQVNVRSPAVGESEGVYNLVVRASPTSGEHVIVPVDMEGE